MRFDLDNYFGVHAQSMSLRAERTKILASNIANADTPNYKARDIDFKAALNQSLQTQRLSMKGSHQGHLMANGEATGTSEVLYRVPTQASLDGNTVDTQVEKSLFAENAVRYQVSLQFLNGRINSLVKAFGAE